ncbi:hypothetical protein COO60DRAFT_1701734 [Scenedesmus sp. NREL 46B-D3]|nr:hypothetical protein COO60DRAFT_1701734 [Scenedesmus sp. NREL 46B-D3]
MRAGWVWWQQYRPSCHHACFKSRYTHMRPLVGMQVRVGPDTRAAAAALQSGCGNELPVAVSHVRLLSWLLCAVGLLGLLALPLLERSISFDENALLAGSARPTIRSKSPGAHQAGRAFAASLQDSLFSGRPFTAALQQQLRQQLRVQVYNHTFTVTANGVLAAAAAAAARSDGKEALLLATPINHQEFSTDFEQDAPGALLALALGSALLAHLGPAAPWLAKEVVWLLPDASCGLLQALQAWADAYQRPVLLPSASPAGSHLEHFGRAGVLQQGLLLELPSGSGNRLQVSLEGHEGLLPKLDLFWLIRWYCHSYVRAPVELTHMGWTLDLQGAKRPPAAASPGSLPMRFLGSSSSSTSQPALLALQRHMLKFTAACQFMWRQARGLPTGGHAPFKDLMADVATLRVLVKDPQGLVVGPAVLGGDALLGQLCDAVELLLRSCSGLVERFHHSLFLYVLTDLEHYVSVERYIVPLVALICVLALQVWRATVSGAAQRGSAGCGSAGDSQTPTSSSRLAALLSIPEKLRQRGAGLERQLAQHSGPPSAAAAARGARSSRAAAAAAAVDAAACLNWALSYMVCLLLVPLAMGCAPVPVTRILSQLSTIPAHEGLDTCSRAAEVLLMSLSQLQAVDTVSLSTHTQGYCLLAGAAGLGVHVLEERMVVSGSSWAPSACCQGSSPFLYRTARTADDAATLPEDWAALHEVAGLRTFLAAQVMVPGQGVVGVLCLASRSAGAFMEGSWSPLLSMAATGLVPCLASPWLAGLSGLAGGLADVASMDGFTGFAAGFLQGAGQLLGSVTNRHLGVRLGLLGEAGEELLLLQPREGTAILSSPSLLVYDEASAAAAAAAEDSLSLYAAVPTPPADLAVAADDVVGSMVVVPLFAGDGAVLGGLYLVHEETGSFLKEHVYARQAAAMLQGVWRQHFSGKAHWDELLCCCSASPINSPMATGVSCYSSSTTLSAAACLPGRSVELGVLQKTWRMQDKQVQCATAYTDELQLHSVLGEGGFSVVYNGTWHGSSTAVKVMRLSPDDKLGIPAKSAMEMAALSTLRHPNIVTCYACLTDMVQERLPAALDLSKSSSSTSLRQQQGPLGIRFHPASESDLSDSAVDSFNILVMERCDRGNLSDAVCCEGLLHRRGPDGVLRVSMGLLYTVLLDVAAALRYMHSLGLVHLDVKASNVLLQTTSGRLGGFPVAKLGDLGLVKLLGKGGSLVNRSTSGTLTHLAPERLQEGSLITPAADAYSFGMLMYELYTGQQPYSGLAPGPELMRAVFDGLRPRLPDSTPPGYTALAEACWSRHTSQRPSLEEIVARLQEQYNMCWQGHRA